MRLRIPVNINAALYLGALLGFGVLHAETTPSRSLLVLAKTDNTLAIVDPKSLHIVARMPSGPDPHEVIASADGRFAYISNYGGGAYNTLTVVDLVEQKTLPADRSRRAARTSRSHLCRRQGLVYRRVQ